MRRREFIRNAAGLVLLAGTHPWTEALAQSETAPASGKPLNLLFITFDDLNGSMPGYMGNPLKLTPNLDAFAATAHQFRENRDVVPICQPSREAMMTGRLPQHTGALGFNPIRPGIPTLTTVMQRAGYFAAAQNKLSHMAPRASFPWDKSVDQTGKNPMRLGDEVASALAAAKAAAKPFYINCNIQDPHRPFYGAESPKKKKKVSAEDEEGGAGADASAVTGILSKPLTGDDVTVPSFMENLPNVRTEYAQYCNSVQRLDLSFGKILAALQASGEMERTVILVVSDHGMPFPMSKATVYRNGPWCPTLLHYPGMGTPQVHDELTSSLDIMPTLLGILNLNSPGLEGQSWMPLLKGEKQENRDHVIVQVTSLSSHKFFPQRLVQTKTGAFIFAPWADGENQFQAESMMGLTYAAMSRAADSDPQIRQRVDQYIKGHTFAYYDLVKDPDQRNNVIDDPAYKPEIDRLRAILLAHMQKNDDPQLENYQTLSAGQKIRFNINSGTSKKIG